MVYFYCPSTVPNLRSFPPTNADGWCGSSIDDYCKGGNEDEGTDGDERLHGRQRRRKRTTNVLLQWLRMGLELGAETGDADMKDTDGDDGGWKGGCSGGMGPVVAHWAGPVRET